MQKPPLKYKDQHLKNMKNVIKKQHEKSLLKLSTLKNLKTKSGSNTDKHISHIAYRSSSKKGKEAMAMPLESLSPRKGSVL